MTILIAFLVSLTVSALTSPLIMRALVHAKSRQTISEHVAEHAHKQGTPTMGGIIILIGMLAGMLVAPSQAMVAPLLIVLGFAAIGFVDDFVVPRLMAGKRGLGWKQKLILQVVLSTAALWVAGVRGPTELSVGVFLILFFSNAYNFSDGLDGLAGSLAVILAVGMTALLPLGWATNWSNAALISLVALAGGLIPFLFWNAPPARVFMGDVGALPIGAFFGYIVARVGAHQAHESQWMGIAAVFVLSLVMVIELVPVPLQILSVKLRGGKRLFPRTPIHHAFQHAGWPETRVTAMFVLLQLLCAIISTLMVIAPFLNLATEASDVKMGVSR